MKIMMLGWEYPPLISGGLATACEGLTRAISAQGIDIDFVLPRRTGREDAGHMSVFSCSELKNDESNRRGSKSNQMPGEAGANFVANENHPEQSFTRKLSDSEVDSLIGSLYSSYARPRNESSYNRQGGCPHEFLPREWQNRKPHELMSELILAGDAPVEYNDNTLPGFLNDPLFREVIRYTREVMQISRAKKFDLVHAHDWMTFPAGILLAKAAGVPLVTHVHSLEYDRCGDGGNQFIRAIENVGVHAADRVIAVSEYTRHMINEKLGIDPERITVAHNGVKQSEEQFKPHLSGETPLPTVIPGSEVEQLCSAQPKKRVLFLGRVTYQKGPDIFVEAAARVLKHHRDVTFVLAGNGDMLPRVRERVRQLGIEEYFEFPGFVTGKKLDEEFGRADLYVMPSISEPFGIAPLEALTRGTPALISKQSGVSEVLSHVLKSDFWDVRKMADFILNAILHPELGRSMMAMSRNEVRRLRWESAANDVISAYREALHTHHFAEVV